MNLYPAPASNTYHVIVSAGPYRHHIALPAKSEEHAKAKAIEAVRGLSPEYREMAWEATIAPDPRQPIERGDAA